MNVPTDTIVAPATASGGAIAVIRLSGPEAIACCDRIFRGRKPLAEAAGHTLHYGEVIDGDRTIDDVVAAIYRAPHSYTGEDAVELSCHGSPYIVSEINNHARYNLQLLEETQLLSGNGSDANIKGLLSRDIQKMVQDTDSDPDRIFKARTKIALATGFRASHCIESCKTRILRKNFGITKPASFYIMWTCRQPSDTTKYKEGLWN